MEILVFGGMLYGALFGTGIVTIEPVSKYVYTVEVHKEVLNQGKEEFKFNESVGG